MTRRRRQQRTIVYGSAEAQVAALAAAYGESFRPDAEDHELLTALERIVVVEIAIVLGLESNALRDELRGPRARFAAGAPPSGKLVELEAPLPGLPAGWSWFASFDVAREIRIIDLDELAHRIPAAAGRWHAALLGESRWIAACAGTPALDPAQGRLVATTNGYTYPLAILADEAADDPLIVEELWDCSAHDAYGRGAAQFWRRALEVRVWERGGECFAVELREHVEPDDD